MDAGAQWVVMMFGEVGLTIRDRIPEMVRSEQERMADAQDASGHRSLSVFGQFWRGILEQFEEFGVLPGASLKNPGGRAPYRVPVINGVVLFPWRYGDGRQGPVSEVPFATSEAREAMFRMGPVPVQDELDLDLSAQAPRREDERVLTAMLREDRSEGESRLKVVVVAIAASTAGVEDITWGEVRLGQEGCLEFLDGESLLQKGGPTTVATDTERTFRAGEPPRKALRLQAEPDEAERADGDA